jgi:phosphatidylserine/phosphatidylglycerophosphate/cardiolipin synthase-like enzyme
VLSKGGNPVAVWTGSTNVSENGIFGHLNCGHIVEDEDVAKAYLRYWTSLLKDPEPKAQRSFLDGQFPSPPKKWDKGVSVVLSPHTTLAVLKAYAAIADSATRALFMSFAFGMAKLFQDVYEQNDRVLRFSLMDKFGNGKAAAQGKIDISRIRRLPNVVVAVGNAIQLNAFDRWLAEKPGLKGANVRWVHTKVMLVDPLGPDPTVVTGSANFSAASTNTNDENMLVIRGDQRVADIYLGEFMRTYSHYAFREAVAISKEKGEDWKPSDLDPTDKWQKDYFIPGQRSMRREYFAGM